MRLISFIKKFADIYNSQNDESQRNIDTSISKKNFISSSLEESISLFKNKFGKSEDLTIRYMRMLGIDGAVITIGGLVDKEALSINVLNRIPIDFAIEGEPIKKYEYLRDNLITSCDIVQLSAYEDALYMVMSGFALIALDGCDRMIAVGVQGYDSRSISEPSSETVQRGSREGFVEPLRINMTLIRRRLKNPDLRFETLKVGSISNTEICICYINSKVSDEILTEVKKRLESINLETVMASGYIMPYLEEKNDLSLFSSVGMSERPDTVCGKLEEGRVAIIVDGTPNVLVIPYLFTEYFQSMDDYIIRPYFATFARLLRYLGFFI